MKEPKEKANELCQKMFIGSPFDYPDNSEFKQAKEDAKTRSLICVDEIIEATKENKIIVKPNTLEHKYVFSKYWKSVKTEIELL
jgi:hypothetical protein